MPDTTASSVTETQPTRSSTCVTTLGAQLSNNVTATVASSAVVEAFPHQVGRKSWNPLPKYSTAAEVRMQASRTSTRMVTGQGMAAMIASATNSETSSSLSASGSRYSPSEERWLKRRATQPSKPSLIAAPTKMPSAQSGRRSTTAANI